MTIESIKAFLEKVSNDPDLQKMLAEKATPEAIVEAAKNLGFDFTVEELTTEQAAGFLPVDLTDSDLDMVVGGAAQCINTEDDQPTSNPPSTYTSSCSAKTEGTAPRCGGDSKHPKTKGPACEVKEPEEPNPGPEGPGDGGPSTDPEKKFF